MKTIEEKAKAYDEAIERAKNFIENGDKRERAIAESIFAEVMEEPEDEKIRKWLIAQLKIKIGDNAVLNNMIYKAISWLKKQKVLSAKEDIQGREDVLWCIKQAQKYAKDENEMGTCWFAEEWLKKQGVQSPYSGVSFSYNGHTWGMCARDGGVEILMDGNLKAFVSLDKSFVYPVNPVPLFKAKNFYVSKVDGLIHDMTYNPTDAEKKKIDDYCRENCKGFQETGKCFFDDECAAKKAYKQKSAKWSEEDDRMLHTIIADFKGFSHDNTSTLESHFNECIDWLKSLRSKFH